MTPAIQRRLFSILWRPPRERSWGEGRQRDGKRPRRISILTSQAVACAIALSGPTSRAQSLPFVSRGAGEAATLTGDSTPRDVLSPGQWRRVDAAMRRALAFLASQQQADGSFPTRDFAHPGVTSLCVLALMAHGHQPGEGPHGEALDLALDFIIAEQKRNGLIARAAPDGPTINRNVTHQLGVAAAYSHAISSLALAETFGMCPSRRTARMQQAIERSIVATLQMQRWPKELAEDRGGWRYVNDFDKYDSDLSVTGWQLMFLRSARNAGFNVPSAAIDDAVGYVRRTFNRRFGVFGYNVDGSLSRGMAGAGILALGHAGFHDSAEARAAGEWLSRYSFDDYNGDGGLQRDRYHYSLFNCCQGMYQLGSPYWEEFFPRTVAAVLPHQRRDGSWDAERRQSDRMYGTSYTTALVALALGAPNQLLPIFQR